jgi:hypothetical protein
MRSQPRSQQQHRRHEAAARFGPSGGGLLLDVRSLSILRRARNPRRRRALEHGNTALAQNAPIRP